jgi:para-aminobenzoate synthetase/4-amino-4-deoxychorismate lyase
VAIIHHTVSCDFALFESLLWEPGNGYFLLERHVARLNASGAHFHFGVDMDAVRKRLLDYAERLSKPRKVRVEVSPSGEISVKDEAVKSSAPLVVALARGPVQSGDEFLRHKTTRREVYLQALRAHREAQDVLLWNEREELTETCHGNVVLDIAGQKVTPALSSGLLPGTFRAELLHLGEIREQVVTLADLECRRAIFMINSVRRWCEMRLANVPDAIPR